MRISIKGIIFILYVLSRSVLFSDNALDTTEKWIIENIEIDKDIEDTITSQFDFIDVHNLKVNTDGYIIYFELNSDNDSSQFQCFQRETDDEAIYEYWVVKKGSPSSKNVKESLVFALTKTHKSEKVVLHESQQFIEMLSINEDYIFYFNASPWNLLKLRAWDYHAHFKYTDLDDYEYYVVEDKNSINEEYDTNKVTIGFKKIFRDNKADSVDSVLESDSDDLVSLLEKSNNRYKGRKGRTLTIGSRATFSDIERLKGFTNIDVSYFSTDLEDYLNFPDKVFNPFIGHSININFGVEEEIEINYSLALYPSLPIRRSGEWHLSLIPIARLGGVYSSQDNSLGVRYDVICPLLYGIIAPYISQTFWQDGNNRLEAGIYFKIPIFLTRELSSLYCTPELCGIRWW